MELPDMMVDEQINDMINDFANRLQSQGISLQQFMELTGQKIEDIANQFRPDAIKRIQTRLVLEAVAKAENIVATEEQIEAEFQKLADQVKMDIETVRSGFGPEQRAIMAENVAMQEAISFLVAKANFVD